jgi:hypothetical protein
LNGIKNIFFLIKIARTQILQNKNFIEMLFICKNLTCYSHYSASPVLQANIEVMVDKYCKTKTIYFTDK